MYIMDDTYSKTYYHINREKILALQRERRKDPQFREKMKVYYRNYYKQNRNKILQQSRTRRGTTVDNKTNSKCIEILRGEFIVSFS